VHRMRIEQVCLNKFLELSFKIVAMLGKGCLHLLIIPILGFLFIVGICGKMVEIVLEITRIF